jgi:drug/metabolite transporter (DMT)-like permease
VCDKTSICELLYEEGDVYPLCRYSTRQVCGSALAVSGLVVLILSDSGAASRQEGMNPWLGDVLAMVGATCYAALNVLEEHMLAQSSQVEMLAGMGTFGALWSFCSMAIFEARVLIGVSWDWSAVQCLLAYTALSFSVYCGAIRLLQSSGSVVRIPQTRALCHRC